MLEIVDAEPMLRNTASAEQHGYAPQPDDRAQVLGRANSETRISLLRTDGSRAL